MKKSAGFTLIELVIVIVILGILGAVAAPRFINMQGDAYEANVKALKGSIQSAMTLANTKAILGGYDNVPGPKNAPTGDDLDEVSFVYGFPAASQEGIIAMLQDTDSFSSTDKKSTYETDKVGNTLIIAPRARGIEKTIAAEGGTDEMPADEGKKCQVEYTQASKADNVITPAKVKAFTKGC